MSENGDGDRGPLVSGKKQDAIEGIGDANPGDGKPGATGGVNRHSIASHGDAGDHKLHGQHQARLKRRRHGSVALGRPKDERPGSPRRGGKGHQAIGKRRGMPAWNDGKAITMHRSTLGRGPLGCKVLVDHPWTLALVDAKHGAVTVPIV